MKKVTIQIPFTTYDCEQLIEGNDFGWSFLGKDENGETVQVIARIYNEETESEIL